MKEIINISLGSGNDDYEFETKFIGDDFRIRRIGTDGDLQKASDQMIRWNNRAAAIGLGSVKFPYAIGFNQRMDNETRKLSDLARKLDTPVTTGDTLRSVTHEWCLRNVQFIFGENYFNNARVLFLSGMANLRIARVMAEYTDNLFFADPLLGSGIPRLMSSLRELELYASGVRGFLEILPTLGLSKTLAPIDAANRYLLRRAMRKASIIVIPYYDFYRYLDLCTVDELKGKTVITSTAYDDRIKALKEKGVDVIIDTTPKIFKRVVGVSVLEATIIASLNIKSHEISPDDLLEIISKQKMDPRVVYPAGRMKRVNRFAYVIHPGSQDHLKKIKPIEAISRVAPPMVMNGIEKAMAYAPPFIYSKVTGIRSPNGMEAEGWLISLGMTTEEMLQHRPAFTRNRLMKAARLARGLGAQVMGLGLLAKDMGPTVEYVARHADLPVTTGNSYIASTALWAAADAVRRMGIIPVDEGNVLKGKTMVIGATGSVGAICGRLLAKAFEEVHLVSRGTAKLLALQASIREESPDAKITISTRVDKYLGDMDVVVCASAGARKDLDIMKVKPGCVITDVTRPLILSPGEIAQRPDVLVIKSGEILLPGEDVEMKDIGLPPHVAPADLAETIILALEGRFEAFTYGSDPEWQKVREIYRTGLKHGMKLAAISGVNGIIRAEDIDEVRRRALAALKRDGRAPERRPAAKKALKTVAQKSVKQPIGGKAVKTASKSMKSPVREGSDTEKADDMVAVQPTVSPEPVAD